MSAVRFGNELGSGAGMGGGGGVAFGKKEGAAITAVKAFQHVRDYSIHLSDCLSEEDCCAQSMCDASPVKWHLAHTSWFFETFILEPYEPRFIPFNPVFKVLFNSYYKGVGNQYPRAQRGLLTRPSLVEIYAYRTNINQRICNLLLSGVCDPKCFALLELGIQHEQQHQELMLTDIKHLLSLNPLNPAYFKNVSKKESVPTKMEWISFDAGVVNIGYEGSEFCFDNERPRHRQFVEAFACSSRLVCNIEFLDFIKQGGYDNQEYWLDEGWNWRCANHISNPIYWKKQSNGMWYQFTLYGLLPLDLHAPVLHLSYFEADAFARWFGARLLTEAEWEHAARSLNNVVELQFFGTAWQWTSSSYAAYPGYTIPAGTIGEYNGKFMVNQYVLRGSSEATPPGHSRISYRNFFPTTACWQYSGIRLARSIS